MTSISVRPSGRRFHPVAGNPDKASAIWASVNPSPFQARICSSVTCLASQFAATISASTSAIRLNRCKNQRVILPVPSRTSSIPIPRRNASTKAPILRSVATFSQLSKISLGSGSCARSSIDSPSLASASVSGRG